MDAARVERGTLLVVLTAVVAAGIVRLDLAWTDTTVLLRKTLPDDAFYYFQIARHLAHGGGASFDGRTVTNGFHPLWLVTLVPLFSLSGTNPSLPIHLSLTLATLLSLATVALVYAMVRTLTADRFAAALAAAAYAFNPWATLESLNGLETALGTCLLAAAAAYYLGSRTWSDRRALGFGVLAGLMILARTDSVFVFACALLALRTPLPRAAWWRTGAVAGLSAAVLVAPWLLWSLARAGALIQSSGLAVPFVLHGNIVPRLGTDSLGRWVGGETLDGIRQALRYSGTPWPPLPFILVVAALALARRRGDSALPEQLARLNFLAAALGLLVLFHSAYRLYPRGWYFVPVALLAALYIGVLLAAARHTFPGRTATTACAAAALLLVGADVAQFAAAWRTGVYPWQSEMLAEAQWVRAHTPPGTRVGAFNAGIMAYWNPERTVINLDGVVNRDAFAAIRQRRLWDYIDRSEIAYLIDYAPYLLAAPADFSGTYAPYMGTAPLAHATVVGTIPGTLHGADIVILRVHRDGS